MASSARSDVGHAGSIARRAFSSACLVVVAVQPWRLTPAVAQDAPTAVPPRFVGRWTGPWRLGMNSGRIELLLTDDPRVPGTIAITNMAKFGDRPAEISKIALDGEKLLFRAYGADNSVMKVSMVVNATDGSIEGFVVHDGFTNLCKLMRVP